jgi:hypothetical protein
MKLKIMTAATPCSATGLEIGWLVRDYVACDVRLDTGGRWFEHGGNCAGAVCGEKAV